MVEAVSGGQGMKAVAVAARFPRVSATPRGLSARLMEDGPATEASFDSVSPSFFDVMRVPLRAGRVFTWNDRDGTPPVTIVSEGLARALAPGGDVLGKRLRFGTGMPLDAEIVGVVADVTQGDPRVLTPRVVYLPLLQSPSATVSLLVVGHDTAASAANVRSALAPFGRHYLSEMVPLTDYLARSPSVERLGSSVAVAIAILAVLLAGIGVHGAFAFAVERRNREIGLRLALGAARTRLMVDILGEAMLLVGLGIAVGVPLAVAAARSLNGLLFGVSVFDPSTYSGAAAFLILLAVGAVTGPAVRAARIDPAVMLRSE
jgi:hypothetical protein